MSISGLDFKVFGGHLLSAKISVFGEFFIIPTEALGKSLVPEIGLRKIDLDKK